MSLIYAFARIPLYVWMLVAGAWGYYSYTVWEGDVYQPLLSSLQGKSNELLGLKGKNKQAEEFKKVREQKFREREELELKFRETAALIPPTADIATLMTSLADIGDKVGLDIVEFRPGSRKTQEFLNIIPIELQVKGTYTQIMSFLDESSQLKRVITPKIIKLDRPTFRRNSSLLTAQATLYVYSMDQAVAAAAVVQSALPPAKTPPKKQPAPKTKEKE